MNYRCTLDTPDGSTSRNGSIRVISHAPVFTEAQISGRGLSFHVIMSSPSNGVFLRIPNRGIGCELSRLDDVFWDTVPPYALDSSRSPVSVPDTVT